MLNQSRRHLKPDELKEIEKQKDREARIARACEAHRNGLSTRAIASAEGSVRCRSDGT